MNKKLILIFCALALCIGGCKKLPNPFARKAAEKSETKSKEPVAPAAPAQAPPQAAASPAAPAGPTINKTASVIVLCYHNIEDGSKMKALTISIAEFERQMQEIKDNGFTVVSMQDFLAWRRGEKDIAAKSAVITIDDGWVSGYDNAWPVLKKFGYPFTLFIYVNYIGSGGKSLSWDQLAEMRDGGVDIQSHTYSHSNLRAPGTGVDKRTQEMVRKDIAALGQEGWLRKEVLESKVVLEKQLGIKCTAFAYPFGIYTTKAREMVKTAGYEAAFTVYGQQLRHSSPPFDLLGRYAVEAAKPQIFAAAMQMVGGGSGAPISAAPATAQLAAASMLTQPMEGETIKDSKPTIKANLAAMGPLDAGSIEMRVSGLGLVPAQFDAAAKTVTYKVTTPLRDKNYTVILSAKSQGKKVETRWNFNFDPSGAAPSASVSQ